MSPDLDIQSQGDDTRMKKRRALPVLAPQDAADPQVRQPKERQPLHKTVLSTLYTLRWVLVLLAIYLLLRNPDILGFVHPVSPELVNYD